MIHIAERSFYDKDYTFSVKEITRDMEATYSSIWRMIRDLRQKQYVKRAPARSGSVLRSGKKRKYDFVYNRGFYHSITEKGWNYVDMLLSGKIRPKFGMDDIDMTKVFIV